MTWKAMRRKVAEKVVMAREAVVVNLAKKAMLEKPSWMVNLAKKAMLEKPIRMVKRTAREAMEKAIQEEPNWMVKGLKAEEVEVMVLDGRQLVLLLLLLLQVPKLEERYQVLKLVVLLMEQVTVERLREPLRA